MLSNTNAETLHQMGGMDNLFRSWHDPKSSANPSNTSILTKTHPVGPHCKRLRAIPEAISKHVQNPLVMQCFYNPYLVLPPRCRCKWPRWNARRRTNARNARKIASPALSTPPPWHAIPTATQAPQPEPEEELDEETKKERAEKKERRAKADAKKEEAAVFYKKREFDAAITLFKEAIEIDATNPVYLMNIAACEFEQGKFTECVDSCNAALNISGITGSQKSKTHARKGNAFSKLKQFQDAIDSFKRSVLEENNPTARQGLRQAEQDLKQWKTEQYYDDAKSEEAKELGNKAYSSGEYSQARD
jgi:tetratricopeptide (TPR) repeat protein